MPEIRSIGILGGTFDPVHIGHMQVAREVKSCLEIEDFRLMPVGLPVHRSGVFASARQRVAMLELAIENEAGLSVDCREIKRGGPSWMVLSLEELRKEHPGSPIILVLGQDSANALDSWHRWKELPGLAHLVVVNRPGETQAYSAPVLSELEPGFTRDITEILQRPGGCIMHVTINSPDISSTTIRTALRNGNPMDDVLPLGVPAYIDCHGLYRTLKPISL